MCQLQGAAGLRAGEEVVTTQWEQNSSLKLSTFFKLRDVPWKDLSKVTDSVIRLNFLLGATETAQQVKVFAAQPDDGLSVTPFNSRDARRETVNTSWPLTYTPLPFPTLQKHTQSGSKWNKLFLVARREDCILDILTTTSEIAFTEHKQT